MDRVEKIYKSDNNRVFFGISGGIAEYLDCNPDTIRLLFLLLTFANGVGVVLYVVLIFVLPTYKQVMEKEDTFFLEQAILDPSKLSHYMEDEKSEYDFLRTNIISRENMTAYTVVLLGVIFLIFDIVPWSLISAEYQVPFVMVLVGLLFVAKAVIYKDKTI